MCREWLGPWRGYQAARGCMQGCGAHLNFPSHFHVVVEFTGTHGARGLPVGTLYACPSHQPQPRRGAHVAHELCAAHWSVAAARIGARVRSVKAGFIGERGRRSGATG